MESVENGTISSETENVFCPYLKWLKCRFVIGGLLMIFTLLFGIIYLVLNNWSCRTGLIAMASIIFTFAMAVIASASAHAELSFVLGTTIVTILLRY